MKKIIAAFDGLKYSASTRDYAIYMAKQTNTHLVGVFMDDRIYNSYKVYELMVKDDKSGDKMKKLEAIDKVTRDEAAKDFEKACQKEGLEYTIHHDHNIAINELKHESIYADLLIIDSKETLTHYTEKQPTRFIRDLLNDAQCPVLLVPQKKSPIQKVVLLYDGEPASVHAIKMYSYLLPELKDIETEVISVNPANTTLHMPDNKLMKEFMKRHHPKAKYTVLKGLAEDEIIKHLKRSQDNSLVVLGVLRRGTVSRWFRENMADILMRELKLPLFVVHDK